MSLALLSVAGVALDGLLGEPKRWHPLVAFGRLADRLERRFNRARVPLSTVGTDSPSPVRERVGERVLRPTPYFPTATPPA